MTTRLKYLIILLVILLSYCFYYLAVPKIINNALASSKIEQMLQKELGMSTKLINPSVKMGILPSIWLLCDELDVQDGVRQNSPLYLKKMSLKVHLFPLLIGKIHVGHFSSDKININLKFDKHSRFYIGDYLLITSSNPKLSFENSQIDIDEYKIKIDDEIRKNNITFAGDYLKVNKFNSKKEIDLSVNSRIISANQTSTVKLDVNYKLPIKKNFNNDDILLNGSIHNLDLSVFSQYLNSLTNQQIKKLSGMINLEIKTTKINESKNNLYSKVLISDLFYQTNDMPFPIFSKNKIEMSSNLQISKNKLTIKDGVIKTPDSAITTSGNINKIGSIQPNGDIKVSILKAKAEDIIPLLPPLDSENLDVNLLKLKQHGFHSDITGNIEIKGRLKKPEIKGLIVGAESYVFNNLPPNTKKALIKLNFLTDKLDLYVNVPTGKNEYVLVKGLFNLYNKKETFIDISSSKNVNLEFAHEVLIPIHEVFRFDLGPLPVMKISGLGNITLKIEGDKFDPHLIGAFNFNNANVSFNDLNLLLTNGYGSLFFQDNMTQFVTNSALLNNKPIKIDGKCSLKGVLSFDVDAPNQNLNDLVNILKTSAMLKDINKFVKYIDKADGSADLAFNLNGKVKAVEEMEFGKNIFAKGSVKLSGNSISDSKTGLSLKNIFGQIDFNNTDILLNTYSIINKSKIAIEGEIKNDFALLQLNANTLYLADILPYLEKINAKAKNTIPSISGSVISLTGEYRGDANNIDFNAINVKGKVFKNDSHDSDISINNGNFELNKSNLKFEKIQGEIFNNRITTTGLIKNLFLNPSIHSLYLISNDFNLASIEKVSRMPYLPKKIQEYLSIISSPNGKIDLNISIKNDNIYSKIKLDEISFILKNYDMPIKIFSGLAEIKGEKIFLFKVNSLVDSMPILVDGRVEHILTTPYLNLYLNSKPAQKFVDKYLNKNSLYPLKIKGDIICSSRLRGTFDNLSAKTELNLEQNSSIYYMGSMIGDASSAIRLYLDTLSDKNSVFINNFQYDKLITSQNNREFVLPQINAKGLVRKSSSGVSLHNFRIKTQNPTDAKIFNIIFKKPMIKQGLFTSDLIVNGPATSPFLQGDIGFTSINIPLLDTTVKDISLRFDNKYIFINAIGEIFTNKITASLKIINNLNPPFLIDDIEVNIANLDVNAITKSIHDLELQSDKHGISGQKKDIDLSSVVIKNAKLKADNVLVRNVNASNLLAKMSLNENMVFALDNFQFDIAEGKAKGNFKYNLLNSMTNLEMKINSVNANLISEALFDLKNQIHGSLTGDVSLYCNGKSHKTCMDTLGGRGGFEVSDGKMPKLGSMEYLLKAGNLVKSGVTGLTINSLIDVITPLKTGQFDSIRGNFDISQGVANTIQIFTKGKDLSLFIDGKYNFSNSIADMNIYGRLAKKISTVLGPVGNASLNTLFNTIPGLHLDDPNNADFIKGFNKIPGFELNDKLYRIFTVEIFGDINGENYVKSFRWVE